jgi:hypothetical protein
VISVLSLNCPVCGAPFSPGAERCGYCGSILVLQTDHPRIDPRALNRTVVDKHIAEYRELLRRDPNSVKAHYGLGVAYYNLGLTEAAIDSLDRACSITPENPHIHTQLAVAWREEARTGDARAGEEMRDHIGYALQLDPHNVEALILASEAARADWDLDSAVNYSEQAWSLEPDRARDLHKQTLRAWITWKIDRGDATSSDLARVRKASPPLAEEMAAYAKGRIRAQAGRFGQTLSTSIGKQDDEMAEPPGPAAAAVRNALLQGTGLALVGCCVIAAMTDDVAPGSGASSFLGFVYLALLFLPILMAWRAWDAQRKKDPFA